MPHATQQTHIKVREEQVPELKFVGKEQEKHRTMKEGQLTKENNGSKEQSIDTR